MPNCARAAGIDVRAGGGPKNGAPGGVVGPIATTAWAAYSSTVARTVPPASCPPMTKMRDCTPRIAVAIPWLRRGVRPVTVNADHVPGPTGSAWNRCTIEPPPTTDGALSEDPLPDTTWISCSGSAVLIPPATVTPVCATAVGSEATVRQVSVVGLYSSTVEVGSALATVDA